MQQESYSLTKIKLKIRIGEMLVDAGVISEEQLDQVLKDQKEMQKKGEKILIGDLISSQFKISKSEIENIFAKYLLFSVSQLFYEILRNDAVLSERFGSPDNFIDRTDIYIPKWEIKKEKTKEVINAELAIVITPKDDNPVMTVNMPFEYIIEDQIANIDLPEAAEFIKTKLLKEKGLVASTDLGQIGIILPTSEDSDSTRILYVDDEEYQRELMQKLLSKLGYEVKSAGSAEEALTILEDEEFQVVITDLNMPGMGGIELCEKIRRSVSNPVVYALSGYIASFGTDNIGTAGFDGYLSKPVSLNNLKNAVEVAMEKSRKDVPDLAAE